ncbi:MAG TPA: hypothetical protein ENJ09_06880, partial [Planctomycetes bacterium]|nr:hypothetical protein [Planctomycetota bacterium]
MVRVSRKIRQLVLDAGLVTEEEWGGARDTGQPIVDVLLERGQVEEEKLFELLGVASGIPPIDLSRATPSQEAIESLPQETCIEHCVIPLARNGDALTIAISDPFDVLLLDDLNILSGCRVRPVLSHPAAIRAALTKQFNRDQQEVEDLLGDVTGTEIQIREDEPQDLDISSGVGGEDVPAVKLVNLMILRALREKASDIHVEPMETQLRIRYRIDGRLVEAMTPPKSLLPAVMSRLKILANLDIAIRFEPQDGKFQIRYEGRTV